MGPRGSYRCVASPDEEPSTTSSSATCAADTRQPSSSSSARVTNTSISASYAEEWRRQSLNVPRWSRRQSSGRTGLIRASTLEGVVTTEDENGDKRVARGFTKPELDSVLVQWSCAATAEAECAICFITGEKLRKPLLMPCDHVFCADCVAPWLTRCALCPMCRQDLRPSLEAVPRSRPGTGSRCGRSSSCLITGLSIGGICQASTLEAARRPPHGGDAVQKRDFAVAMPISAEQRRRSLPPLPGRNSSRSQHQLG